MALSAATTERRPREKAAGQGGARSEARRDCKMREEALAATLARLENPSLQQAARRSNRTALCVTSGSRRQYGGDNRGGYTRSSLGYVAAPCDRCEPEERLNLRALVLVLIAPFRCVCLPSRSRIPPPSRPAVPRCDVTTVPSAAAGAVERKRRERQRWGQHSAHPDRVVCRVPSEKVASEPRSSIAPSRSVSPRDAFSKQHGAPHTAHRTHSRG